MKPASSHTTSRLVWVARAALKGIHSCRHVVAHVGEGHDEAVDDLQTEEQHAGGEEGPGDTLGFVLVMERLLHFCARGR
jgi:hypothetical protein